MQRKQPLLIEAPQRSDEWHKARLGIVTASRAKDTFIDISDTQKLAAVRTILGISAVTAKVRETTEFAELWSMDQFALLEKAGIEPTELASRKSYREGIVAERLTGLPADPEPYVTYDMKWGIVNEEIAKTVYQMEHKVIVEDAPLMIHPDYKCGASPDGYATDTKTGELGFVEVKCLRSANHLFKIIEKQEIPEEFYDQVQMQMWIGNRDWCDFIGFDSRLPEGLKIFVQRVPYDDDYVSEKLAPSVIRFLDECDRNEKYFRKLIREGTEKNEGVGHKDSATTTEGAQIRLLA